MENLTQIILLISLVALTIVFIVVGIWVVIILKEVRRTLKKAENVGINLEETATIVRSRVKEGLTAASVIRALASGWTKESESNFSGDDKETLPQLKKSPSSVKKKRFFFNKKPR